MTNSDLIQSPEVRLAGVIGQIVVENAKLGYEIEVLRRSVAAEQARAAAAERRIADLEKQLEREVYDAERRDIANAVIANGGHMNESAAE